MSDFEFKSWADTHRLNQKTIDKLISEGLDSIDSIKLINKENVKELELSFEQRHRLLAALDDEWKQVRIEEGDSSTVGTSRSSQGSSRTAVSTDGTTEGLTRQSPFMFNTTSHGSNIIIEYGNSVARSKNSQSDGIVFSDRPIEIEERVHMSLVFARRKTCKGGETMSVGFTSEDPNSIVNLPSLCHPDLSQRNGFWLNPIPDKFVRQENVVSFWATTEGHVLYAINGVRRGLLFSGVDTGTPLWAIIDIHGRAIGVQIVGNETVSLARYRHFERHDRVKIRTKVKVSKELMEDEGIRNVAQGTVEEKWSEFSTCGTEGIVTGLDDVGHVLLKLEKRSKQDQQITGIEGVGFPRSVVSHIEQEKDSILVGDIVQVVNDSGVVEISHNTFADAGPLIGSAVGELGVVLGPLLFPEASLKVRVGHHNRVFKRSDITVKTSRGAILRGPFGELCHDGLHLFDEDVSRICVDCHKCTESGKNCPQMTKQMKDSPGRVCGCKEGSSCCIACGRCKSCIEKTGHTSNETPIFPTFMGTMIKKLVSDVIWGFGTPGSDEKENKSHGLAVGDSVLVNVSDEKLQRFQVGHGGYVPPMKKCIGEVGRVTKSTKSTVMVAFSDGEQWCFNPEALKGVNPSGRVFMEGDTVRFCDDVEKLQASQKGHGGWDDNMNLVAGKTGTVKKVLFNNDLLVSAMGTSFRWNPSSVGLEKVLEVSKSVTDRHGVAVSVDDVVTIDVDPDTIESVQHYPKRYLDAIRKEKKTRGVIKDIDRDGDLLVYYENGKRLYLRTDLVSKEVGVDASEVDTTAVIEVDDLVLIDSDSENVRNVQTESKIWIPEMKQATGKVGRVRAIKPTGTVKVDVGGRTWSFACSLLTKADKVPAPMHAASVEHVQQQMKAAFVRGDQVQIGVNFETLQSLQVGHGSCSSEMEKSIGSIGSIMYIDHNDNTWANFPSYSAAFNTKALVKADVSGGPEGRSTGLSVGDLVKICEDKDAVKARQNDHGGWDEDMNLALGKVGRIDDIASDEDILVKVVGRKWLFYHKNLERLNLQGDGRLPWSQADICSPGKHSWKTGKCMMCVQCVECTDYGLLSPNTSSTVKRPGSVCGCGGSDTGCVDCGKCRLCVEEPSDRGDTEVDLEISATIKTMEGKVGQLYDIFKEMTVALASDDMTEEQFGIGKGDLVRVKGPKDKLEKLQTREHGGYDSRKEALIGATGRVVGFLTGSAIVAFTDEIHFLNPAALEKHAEKEGSDFTRADFDNEESTDKYRQRQEAIVHETMV